MASASAARSTEPVRTIHISEILDNPEISSSARLMYVMLREEMGRDGAVSIYARDLAKRLGVSEKTVGHLNAELRRWNAILTRGQGTGKPLRYMMLGVGGLLATMLSPHGHAEQASLVLSISGDYDSALRVDSDLPENQDPGRAESTKTGARNFPRYKELYNYSSYAGDTSNNNTNAGARATDLVLVQKLIDAGMSRQIAVLCAREFPDESALQLACLPFQDRKITNPGAFLRTAILEGFAPPPRYVAGRRTQEQAAAAAPPAPETFEQRIEREQRERQRIENLLERLPKDVRYQLDVRVDDFLSHGPFSKLQGRGRHELRDVKLVEFAEEYYADVAAVRDVHVETVLEAQDADDADRRRRAAETKCSGCAHAVTRHGNFGCTALEDVRGRERKCICTRPHGENA